MPGSVSSPCANSSPSPVFIPFRCLQAIIMYPLSQAAHIKFFSSFLINQSLNPSKPFNRTSCSSLNSVQFLQVSDNVVTQAGCEAPAADSLSSPSVRSSTHPPTCTHAHACTHNGFVRRMDTSPCQDPAPFLQQQHREEALADYKDERAFKHLGIIQNLKGGKTAGSFIAP